MDHRKLINMLFLRLQVPIPHQSTLLDQLLRMSLHCRHRWSAVAASKCLAGLTNKMIEGGSPFDKSLITRDEFN